jgi:hypothetical protein
MWFLSSLSELATQCVMVIYIKGSNTLLVHFVGLAYKGKNIMFKFIIEYNNLRDFGTSVIIGLFFI